MVLILVVIIISSSSSSILPQSCNVSILSENRILSISYKYLEFMDCGVHVCGFVFFNYSTFHILTWVLWALLVL